MPKGLVFVDANTNVYGFLSNSKAYEDATIETATGLSPANFPDLTAGVYIPWRLEDLLQSKELFSATIYLNDGAGKRTSRRLYVAKEKIGSFRKKVADGGLVGATLSSKTVVGASIARKAANALL